MHSGVLLSSVLVPSISTALLLLGTQVVQMLKPSQIRDYALSSDELRATPIQASFYGRIEKGPSERTGSLAQSWLDNLWFLPPSYLSLSFS